MPACILGDNASVRHEGAPSFVATQGGSVSPPAPSTGSSASKLSAFGLDRRRLVKETLRLLGHGGLALFSTYADEFWDDRLDWFERQSAAGLIGPIDRRRTHDGVIVCTDGFRAATVREGEFRALVADLEVQLECVEVDHSSVFYLVRP